MVVQIDRIVCLVGREPMDMLFWPNGQVPNASFYELAEYCHAHEVFDRMPGLARDFVDDAIWQDKESLDARDVGVVSFAR